MNAELTKWLTKHYLQMFLSAFLNYPIFPISFHKPLNRYDLRVIAAHCHNFDKETRANALKTIIIIN